MSCQQARPTVQGLRDELASNPFHQSEGSESITEAGSERYPALDIRMSHGADNGSNIRDGRAICHICSMNGDGDI